MRTEATVISVLILVAIVIAVVQVIIFYFGLQQIRSWFLLAKGYYTLSEGQARDTKQATQAIQEVAGGLSANDGNKLPTVNPARKPGDPERRQS